MQSKALLMQHLSNSKQIYTGMQNAMLDAATTGKATGNETSIYPADIGVKTNLEYITWLVKHGYFKESDLKIFCKSGAKVKRLQDLKREDIAICFANLSEKDVHDSNTIWIVSRNVVEGPPPPLKWWEFYKPNPFATGLVVLRLGGDGRFYTKQPADFKQVGTLPPREPKFLAP